jgi:hypothetical protein
MKGAEMDLNAAVNEIDEDHDGFGSKAAKKTSRKVVIQ